MANDENMKAFLFNQQHIDQITRVSKPLNYFGITGVHYFKVYKDWRYVMLCNDSDLIKDMLLHIEYSQIFAKEALPVNDIEKYESKLTLDL